MKRIITIALLSVLAVLAAVSCRKEPEQTIDWRTELQVVKSNLVFMPGGGTETLEVNLSNVTVTADKSWCSASVSGNTVSVTASANGGKQSRYAKLTITSGSESVTAAVIQYGEVFDGLALVDMEAPKQGAVYAYPYTANMDVNVKADQDWVHVSFDEEKPIVYVTVDANKGFGYRFATVSFTAGTNSGSARVIQEPTPGQVSGWSAAVTDGLYDFPDQIDRLTITPSGASVLYDYQVVAKDDLPERNIETYAMGYAESVREAVLAKIAAGEITSFAAGVLSGSQTGEFRNLSRTVWVVAVCFDAQGYPTGEYFYQEVAVPDRGPVKKAVDGWDVAVTDGSYAYPVQTDVFTITPKAGYESVKYIATVVKKDAISDVEDYAFTTFAMPAREAILAKVAAGELASFEEGLLSGTGTVSAQDVAGDAYVVIVAFGDNKFYTGDYAAVEVAVSNRMPAYYRFLGNWSVPRGDGADTWIVEINEPGVSFKVSGVGGIDANSFADGAFVAVVPYDQATEEMVFKVYEDMDHTWQDSSRGTMNCLLSGMYTNVQGKTYYNSGVGNTICRAKFAEDGTVALNPASVTSGGAPATFHNIKWYGRYTTSSGSRSGVSWTGYETPLPNVMTRQ